VRNVDSLPPSCAVVTKSGNLNFLEPFWPLQACNGIALPVLACTVMNYKENQRDLTVKGNDQLLVNAGSVNLLGEI